MGASENFSLIKVIIFIAKSCGIGLDNIFVNCNNKLNTFNQAA